MLVKPKILKGEVKEFINITNAYSTESWRDAYKRIMNIKKFYSQPFKPEMIAEYFDEWEIDEKEKMYIKLIITNADISFTHQFPMKCRAGWVWKYERTNVLEYFNLSPKTLSQFITNCVQAGIKLIWKE